MKTPKLRLGLIQEPIKEQLKAQDIVISDEDAEKFEKIIAAVHYLYLNRIMDTTTKRALMAKVMLQLTTLANMDELVQDMADQLGKQA